MLRFTSRNNLFCLMALLALVHSMIANRIGTLPPYHGSQYRLTLATGCHIFHTSSSSVTFPAPPVPAKTFNEWIHQLPEAENRLLSNISFAACDAEQTLLQYLQIECTVHIGTSGGRQKSCGSFSWMIYSPGKEQLILNDGPVDGWHKCQSALCSAVSHFPCVSDSVLT